MTRPDDDQPESADLAGSLQLGNADTLDGPAGDTSDPLDAGYVPPDRPFGLDEDGVTGAGMRDGDTLDERLRREEPGAGAGAPADDDRSGRLTGDASGASDSLDAVDVGIDGGVASAEEAAVHDVGIGDEPAETEPSRAGDPTLADPEADAEVAEADHGHADAFGDALHDARDDGEFAEPTPRTTDAAGYIDAATDAGASAPASGRDDAGPGSGL